MIRKKYHAHNTRSFTIPFVRDWTNKIIIYMFCQSQKFNRTLHLRSEICGWRTYLWRHLWNWIQEYLPENSRAAETWKLFATAVLPEEILTFAEWLGPDFRLPDQNEWKVAVDCLKNISAASLYENIQNNRETNPLARRLLDGILEERSPQTALELCLFFDTWWNG